MAGGRRLAVPPRGTRPTSDRVREALFGGAGAHDPGLDGANVLDLCAGSGALGLEALSRGAAHALFVEADGAPPRCWGATSPTSVTPARGVHGAAGGRARRPRGPAYDVVLVDPPTPYRTPRCGVAAAAAAHGWLADDAVVVVERGRGAAFPWPAPVVALRERRYGDTVLYVGVVDRAAEKRVAHDAGHNRHGASPAG